MLFPAGRSEWKNRVEIPILRQDWKFPFPLRAIWQERVFLPDAGPAASSHVGLGVWIGSTQAWAKLWLESSQGKGPGKNCRWVRINNSPVVPSIPSLCYYPDEQCKVSLGE